MNWCIHSKNNSFNQASRVHHSYVMEVIEILYSGSRLLYKWRQCSHPEGQRPDSASLKHQYLSWPFHDVHTWFIWPISSNVEGWPMWRWLHIRVTTYQYTWSLGPPLPSSSWWWGASGALSQLGWQTPSLFSSSHLTCPATSSHPFLSTLSICTRLLLFRGLLSLLREDQVIVNSSS